ncbi:MAG: prepilin-type N-terminal cleavage/methylation domain-containing protein [Desulfobulbaceae bacterium]|nr:prepilin-type N-terminal cleavage/methylation domain-containing protein [Desulfobulbaceae bacterium]
MKRLFNAESSCDGFTLIEVMIVVAIIGILAAVAAPAYFNHVMRSRQALAVYELMAINASQERYFADNGRYATTLGVLDQYASAAGPGFYQGKYFKYTLANGVVTAKADLDGDPATETEWRLTVGAINDKPQQVSSNEQFGWSSLAAVMAD